MKLSKELNDLIQKHLGQRALDIQKKEGRGLWIATGGTQASYVPLAQLPSVFVQGSRDEFQDIIDLLKEYDPESQVCVFFDSGNEATNITAVVNIK